jgi:hypothetical protein
VTTDALGRLQALLRELFRFGSKELACSIDRVMNPQTRSSSTSSLSSPRPGSPTRNFARARFASERLWGISEDEHSGKLWLARAPGLLTWHHTFSGVTISKEETNR